MKITKIAILTAVFMLPSIILSEMSGDFYASGPTDQKKISLTFDDGPGPYTERILDVLDKHKVKATFFMQGNQVNWRPKIARIVADRGHEIANHTWEHVNYNKRLKDIGKELRSENEKDDLAVPIVQQELKKDILRSQKMILSATSKNPSLLRMPNGIDRPWITEVAREMGLTLVNWTFGKDWIKNPLEQLKIEYADAIKPGAILLFHDGGSKRENTISIVDHVCQVAKQNDFEIVILSDLIK